MYQHNTSLNVKCFHLWNFLKQKIGVRELYVLVRSAVIMAVTTRFTIFWDAIPCSPVDMYQFVQMALRNLLPLSLGKKTVATGSSKMSVPTYQTTSCHTPEDIPFLYTGCNRRNVQDFGRVFLRSNYTDITQNTYIQSWTFTEIMAGEVWNFDSCYSLIDYQIHIETGRNMWFL